MPPHHHANKVETRHVKEKYERNCVILQLETDGMVAVVDDWTQSTTIRYAASGEAGGGHTSSSGSILDWSNFHQSASHYWHYTRASHIISCWECYQ